MERSREASERDEMSRTREREKWEERNKEESKEIEGGRRRWRKTKRTRDAFTIVSQV